MHFVIFPFELAINQQVTLRQGFDEAWDVQGRRLHMHTHKQNVYKGVHSMHVSPTLGQLFLQYSCNSKIFTPFLFLLHLKSNTDGES